MVSTKAPEDAYTAEPFFPGRGGLPALRRAAAECRGCPLHREAAFEGLVSDLKAAARTLS